MLKFVPFYFHDFFNDPRLLELEPIEQQQWLFLLARMMLTEAVISENYKAIGHTLDVSKSTAQKLIVKLKRVGFLTANATDKPLFTLTSKRLTREYEKAKTKCDEKTRISKDRAYKRWHGDESPFDPS